MLLKAEDIKDSLEGYSNRACKLQRLVSEGKYIPVIRGLYETDPDTPGHLLAGGIVEKSYLSFEYALCEHGMISPRKCPYTSATTGSRHIRTFETAFGTFVYRDVPVRTFSFGSIPYDVNGYRYWLATPEKALLDQLYAMKPVRSVSALENLLFDVLGLYRDVLRDIDTDEVSVLAGKYRCANVNLFAKYVGALTQTGE